MVIPVSRTLETPRLLLRNFQREDFAAVHAYGSDPLVTRFMAWGPNRPEDTRRFLDCVVSECAHQPRSNFNVAITLRRSGELIGACGLDMSAEGHSELGYCLASRFWGVGYGTEAVAALIEFGFNELRAVRIAAHVFADNVVSQALLRRIGFTNVAKREKHVFVRNEWHDEYEFARWG